MSRTIDPNELPLKDDLIEVFLSGLPMNFIEVLVFLFILSLPIELYKLFDPKDRIDDSPGLNIDNLLELEGPFSLESESDYEETEEDEEGLRLLLSESTFKNSKHEQEQ